MKFVLFVTLIWSILDCGWSITDEEYIQFKAGLAQIQELRKENQAGQKQIQILISEVTELKSENKQLHSRVDHLEETCGVNSDQDQAQNTTIEERVTILEAQMTEVQEDVTGLQNAVDFLFEEQVLQDERILTLEQETEGLEERVEVLEANGGDGGNVTALEVRVETLEGIATQHETDINDLDSAISSLDGRVETLEGETGELETRLTATETLIEDLSNVTSNLDGRVETLEGETSELETRLTAAETMIEDLEATDVELDARITDLEEGGGGGATNGTTIAFRAVMSDTDDDNIPESSTVIFSDVEVNQGNGYDPATGVFTVPSGGEGYYYFATHFTVHGGNLVYIDIQVNDVAVCTMRENNQDQNNNSNTGCNALVFLEEGDEVQNVYWSGTDSTPVYENTNGVYNGFTGFRI